MNEPIRLESDYEEYCLVLDYIRANSITANTVARRLCRPISDRYGIRVDWHNCAAALDAAAREGIIRHDACNYGENVYSPIG
jgi:hypothetical protein